MTPLAMTDWQGQDPSRVRNELVMFNHRLRESGLFEDESLAKLLDSHPREHLTICTMRKNPPPGERWIAGEAHGVDGGQLLEAVRRGALWISPRRVVNINPVYGALFRRLMNEFTAATGMKAIKADGSLLISGPRMGIFMHVDPAETMLWHIRGSKTLYVYPPREDIVTEKSLEAILLKETLSDLPYHPSMEAHAVAVPLREGQAVSWPIHSPHRVVNGNDLNVSLSIEYSTPRSLVLNGVFYTNGRLRRTFGLDPQSRNTPSALRPALWAASVAWKKLQPLRNTFEASHKKLFDVDLKSPNCVRWRAGVDEAAA